VLKAEWTDIFQLHYISCRNVSSRARTVNCETKAEWLGPHCEKAIVTMTLNADESGIFYRLTPGHTLKFKNEKCVDEKLSSKSMVFCVL
jgi:hypothetical protein